jgi:hypothetical protein
MALPRARGTVAEAFLKIAKERGPRDILATVFRLPCGWTTKITEFKMTLFQLWR